MRRSANDTTRRSANDTTRSRKRMTEDEKLDAVDGKMDGKIFGKVIKDGRALTLAEQMDAADGKMDGKFFGKHIIETEPGGTVVLTEHYEVYDGVPRHMEGDTDEWMTCGLSDPSFPEKTCNYECEGSYMMRRHRHYCPFNKRRCPQPKCGELIATSAHGVELHMQICKFVLLKCRHCKLQYYRMDADYHHSVCKRATVKCPLLCPDRDEPKTVFRMNREDVREHINKDYHLHQPEILLCQDHLPDEHPHRVYGLLLSLIREHKAQLNLAWKPGTYQHFQHDLSPQYSPSKTHSIHYIIGKEIEVSPLPPRPLPPPPAPEPEPDFGMEEVEDW